MPVPHGVIGVVHVPAMPGDPNARLSFDGAMEFALDDARAWKSAGAAALIVENFGSAPFDKGSAGHRIPPHQVALLTRIVSSVRALGIEVGVNCLRNDAFSALGIAAATGASFIRVNVHTGAYVTDQGLIEGEAADTLRYRMMLGADIAILADVLVKHASPLAPVTPEQATHEALDRGLADGVIITGRGTGEPIDSTVLVKARSAAGERPLLLGSGLTPQSAPDLAPYAHAAIVGTYAKVDGSLANPVDPARAKAVVDAATPLFRN